MLGFEHVFDTTFARHVALLEHAQEFHERKHKGNGSGGSQLPMLASACPGWVCYAEKTHAEMLPFISRTKSPQQVMGTLVKEWLGTKWGKTYVPLPISIHPFKRVLTLTRFSSINLIVHSIFTLSFQNTSVRVIHDGRPDQIYHVSVMPCYDKKLEASRSDFYNEAYATRDVDCVITTGELDLLMREKEWDLSVPVPGEDDATTTTTTPSDTVDDPHLLIPELINHPGTSSGSYLHSLIAALLASTPTPLDLTTRTVRTADYEEYVLTDLTTGTVAFRGAKCYGFRNLQNVVRKVGRDAGVQVGRGAAGRLGAVRGGRGRKAGTGAGGEEAQKGYDYVEVMACPGGCVNGGGQLRPPTQPTSVTTDEEGFKRDWEATGVVGEPQIQGQNAKWGDREWTRKVEEVYWHGLTGLPTPPPSPQLDPSKRRNRVEDAKAALADSLAARVLRETCTPKSMDALAGWDAVMDDEAEARRRTLFRTQYRAVESEVVGLAVKW